jgi:hypothetical protein
MLGSIFNCTAILSLERESSEGNDGNQPGLVLYRCCDHASGCCVDSGRFLDPQIVVSKRVEMCVGA